MVTLDRGMGLLQATATNIIGMVGRRPVPDDPVHGDRDGRPAHPLRLGVRRRARALRRPRLRGAGRRAARQRRPIRLPARGLPAVRARPADGVHLHLSADARRAAVDRRRRGRVRRLPRLLLDDDDAAAAQPDGGGGLRGRDGAALPRHHGRSAASRSSCSSSCSATVGWVIVAGLFSFSWQQAFDFPPEARRLDGGLLRAMGAAGLLAMYNYGGYNNVCNIGEEIRDRRSGRCRGRSCCRS